MAVSGDMKTEAKIICIPRVLLIVLVLLEYLIVLIKPSGHNYFQAKNPLRQLKKLFWDRALCGGKSLWKVGTGSPMISRIVQVGRGAQLAKLDIESAYRMIPVHPGDRLLLAVQWAGQMFFDTRLPFGLRLAPKIFTAVADALQWVMLKHGVSWVAHYLDDFITVGPPGLPL